MKHGGEVSKKTLLSEEEIKSLLNDIMALANIRVIALSEYKEFIKAAQTICPDIDDVHYFALAIKLKCAIWSNDKKLKEQDKIKVYASHELVKL